MLYTTFQRLRNAEACTEGYSKLASHIKQATGLIPREYGMDRPIAVATIADSNGLDDTLWTLRNAVYDDKDKAAKLIRSLACDFAEHVLPIFEAKYPDDKRPRQCIEAARRWVAGEASWEEVTSARAAAAAADAAAAAAAAYAAAYAAAAAAAAAYAYAYAAAYAYADAAAAARRTETQWQLDRVKQVLAAESDDCATTFYEGSAVGNEVGV